MKQRHPNPKMSGVFLEYASDYIGMGATLEEKQQYLDSAILAWNLSLFPEGEREKHMQASLQKLEEWNPASKNLEILKYNLRILINRKLAEFPEINKLIVNAQISVADGKECLYVTSTDFEETKD